MKLSIITTLISCALALIPQILKAVQDEKLTPDEVEAIVETIPAEGIGKVSTESLTWLAWAIYLIVLDLMEKGGKVEPQSERQKALRALARKKARLSPVGLRPVE